MTGIAKRHLVERQRGERIMGQCSLGALAHSRLLVKDLDDALSAGCRRVDARDEATEAADRAVELAEVGEEDQQAAVGEPALGKLPGSKPDHHQDAGEFNEVDERRK